MSLAANLRLRRSQMKLSQKGLAERAGVSQQLIHALEAGTTRSSRFIDRISQALECSNTDLDPGHNGLEAAAAKVGRPSTTATLPIFSSVIGFVDGTPDGNAAIDAISRPEPLLNVRNAYGFLVLEMNMTPEFDPGDYVLVNPHMPALPDTSCLFIRQGQNGHSARIARLTAVAEDAWRVQYWKPAGDQNAESMLRRSEWQLCHRIVGRYCRR